MLAYFPAIIIADFPAIIKIFFKITTENYSNIWSFHLSSQNNLTLN